MIIKKNNPYIGPSFTFKNRMCRLIWNFIYLVFFYLSPTPLHKWRIFLLKLFGAKIGKNCHIDRKVEIWAPWNLVLGNYIAIGENVKIYNMDKVIIDDFCIISTGTFFCCGSHDYNSKNFQLYAKPIKLKKNIWICADVFVHPGVEINEGCVVGARSVVTKNLDTDNSVYSGNPCTFIKKRTIFK